MIRASDWLHLKRKGFGADALLGHFGVLVPPVPVVALALKMGVGVFWSPMEEDGALEMDASRGLANIFVNEGAPEVRMRFTVAHELGHLMLHEFVGVHRDVSGKQEGSAEWEANNFAAELLMPEWMVRWAGREIGFHPSPMDRLFNVSEQAMEVRLKALGLYKKISPP